MGYLVEWAWQLLGRSGVIGQTGALAPLSPTVLRDWAAVRGHELDPFEAEALMHLDAAIRDPGEAPVEHVQADPDKRPGARWPKRKGA